MAVAKVRHILKTRTGFGAYVPDLPGCVAHGEPVPPPAAQAERVVVAP